jgi:hypothetical protein
LIRTIIRKIAAAKISAAAIFFILEKSVEQIRFNFSQIGYDEVKRGILS